MEHFNKYIESGCRGIKRAEAIDCFNTLSLGKQEEVIRFALEKTHCLVEEKRAPLECVVGDVVKFVSGHLGAIQSGINSFWDKYKLEDLPEDLIKQKTIMAFDVNINYDKVQALLKQNKHLFWLDCIILGRVYNLAIDENALDIPTDLHHFFAEGSNYIYCESDKRELEEFIANEHFSLCEKYDKVILYVRDVTTELEIRRISLGYSMKLVQIGIDVGIADFKPENEVTQEQQSRQKGKKGNQPLTKEQKDFIKEQYVRLDKTAPQVVALYAKRFKDSPYNKRIHKQTIYNLCKNKK